MVLALAILVVGGVGTAVARSSHASSAAHLPGGFARQMRGLDIAYSDVTGVSNEVRAAALHAASSGSSPIVDQGARPVVVRVTFTDNGYRDHGRRLYVDQPALMLVYPATPLALTGPAGSPSGTIKSTFVDFIDPNTFRYLRAVSFNTSRLVESTD
jgi:hypothetical protein